MSGEQAIFNLQIKKKSGLSLNPDIHHSKVFSSAQIKLVFLFHKTIILSCISSEAEAGRSELISSMEKKKTILSLSENTINNRC